MCPGFPSQPSQEYDKNGSGTWAEKNNPTQLKSKHGQKKIIHRKRNVKSQQICEKQFNVTGSQV